MEDLCFPFFSHWFWESKKAIFKVIIAILFTLISKFVFLPNLEGGQNRASQVNSRILDHSDLCDILGQRFFYPRFYPHTSRFSKIIGKLFLQIWGALWKNITEYALWNVLLMLSLLTQSVTVAGYLVALSQLFSFKKCFFLGQRWRPQELTSLHIYASPVFLSSL